MELPTAPHHLPGRMHAQQHASILAFAFLACTACRAPAGPAQDGTAQAGISDSTKVAEEEVKAMVDSFLVAIGNYDLETVRPLFAPHANIGGVWLKEGVWRTTTYTFAQFDSLVTSRPDPTGYQEPVSHYTVHVEPGGLAFVRADAALIKEGRARSHNIDYFTLIKEEGAWRILSASYVATPIEGE